MTERILTQEEVREALEQAFALSRNWWDSANSLNRILQQMGVAAESDGALAPRLAVGYFLDFPLEGERVSLTTNPFDPLGPSLRPRDHAPAIISSWEAVADSTHIPALLARLNDLLSQCGGPSVPNRARLAIAAYCSLADDPRVGLELEDGTTDVVEWDRAAVDLGLARAISLLGFVGSPGKQLPAEAASAIEAVFTRAAELVRAGDDPGVLAMLLQQLVIERKRLDAEHVGRLRELLEESIVEPSDGIIVDRLGALLLIIDRSVRQQINKRRVQVRLDRAAASEPFVAMSLLQDAQNLARDLGLADLAADATRRMQQLRTADFGWKSISTEVVIGSELIQAQIGLWSAGPDWSSALWSWSRSSPPTGKYAPALDAAKIRASAPRLLNTVSRVIYGADHLPRLTVDAFQERVEYELSVGDRFALQVHGRHLADALDRVSRFGRVPDGNIAGWLKEHGAQAKEPMSALSDSLQAFWTGDFQKALLRSMFAIEASMRHLVLLLDEPAYIAVRTGSPGKYAGIEPMLSILERHDFDPDWDHAIRAFCLGPYGMNTRNDLAHGFPAELPPRVGAALSIRVLMLFVLAGGVPSRTSHAGENEVAIVSVTRTVAYLVRSSLHQPQLIRRYAQRELRDLWTIIKGEGVTRSGESGDAAI